MRRVRIDLLGPLGPARRRVAVGPFVVGGGVALAALSGSVALAATLITASTIHIVTSSPSHSRHVLAASTAPANRADGRTIESGAANGARQQVRTGAGSGAGPTTLPSSHSTGQHRSNAPIAPFAPTQPAGRPQSDAQASSPVAAPSTSGPAGNAVIFLDGYEPASSSLLFRYATVTTGAGPDGSDVYSDGSSTKQYRTQLANGASIVSGSTMCPPAGNRCSPSQLFSAASAGMYAEVAIDPRGQLESVLERDNVPGNRSAAPAPSASASSSASAQPSASPNAAGGGSAPGQ